MADMLKKANDVLYFAVKGISDVIMKDGLFNLDFADVRTVMNESGLALMGTGSASGENRAREAATRAITCPLLEDASVDGAKAVLYNITAGLNVTTEEIREIGEIIGKSVHPEANIIFGMVYDEQAGEELRITVIATGIEAAGDAAAPKQGVVSGAVHDFSRSSRQNPPAPREPARPAGANVTPYPTPDASSRRPLEEQWPKNRQGAPAYLRKERALGGQAAGSSGNEDFERPAYVRRNSALGGQTVHSPGDEDFIFDEEEFEMPAFIRRQAD
jgi:cell division protein FtsZ